LRQGNSAVETNSYHHQTATMVALVRGGIGDCVNRLVVEKIGIANCYMNYPYLDFQSLPQQVTGKIYRID
jgi:hypothetical protein